MVVWTLSAWSIWGLGLTSLVPWRANSDFGINSEQNRNHVPILSVSSWFKIPHQWSDLVLVFGSIDLIPVRSMIWTWFREKLQGDRICRQLSSWPTKRERVGCVREVLMEASATSLDIYRAFLTLSMVQNWFLSDYQELQNRLNAPYLPPTSTICQVCSSDHLYFIKNSL